MKRLPLIFSLLAVLALSASIAYWVMELYKPKQRPLAPTTEAVMPDPSPDAAATLFGGQVAVVASNYQLTGVVAAGREGVAILVADGQPPKALKVGTEIASGVELKEVHPKYVMLSEGGVLKRIELATDDKAAASMALAAPIDQGRPPPPPPPPPQQIQQMQPIPNPMQVPDMPGSSVPVPPPQPNQPMEPPVANPQGVPAPPPPQQMPAPTRNMSGGGQPPTQ